MKQLDPRIHNIVHMPYADLVKYAIHLLSENDAAMEFQRQRLPTEEPPHNDVVVIVIMEGAYYLATYDGKDRKGRMSWTLHISGDVVHPEDIEGWKRV